jgi:hypothetical protein
VQGAGYPLTIELSASSLPKKSWSKIIQINMLSAKRIDKKIAGAMFMILPQPCAYMDRSKLRRNQEFWNRDHPLFAGKNHRILVSRIDPQAKGAEAEPFGKPELPQPAATSRRLPPTFGRKPVLLLCCHKVR